MKRRLRKKFHLGEFREFGFAVAFETPGAAAGDQVPEVVDRFIDEAVLDHRLCAGGGGNGTRWNFFVTAEARGVTVGEPERDRVAGWLQGHPELAGVSVGPLVDAWYGQN